MEATDTKTVKSRVKDDKIVDEERKRSNLKYFQLQIRRLWTRSFAYSKTIEQVKILRKGKAFFRCTYCKREYRKWSIEVDHIVPLHKKYKYQGQSFSKEMAEYVSHLYDQENLQVLCRSCHAEKTHILDKAKP